MPRSADTSTRPTSPPASPPGPALTARIPELDTVRAIAAAGVLLFHVAYVTGFLLKPFWGAWAFRLQGFVSLFFVLSGFVLFRPYVVARASGSAWPAAGPYFVRRAFRIVPAYWLLVVVAFVGVVRPIPDPTTWLRYLTFTQHYVAGPMLRAIGVSWTLTVEVVFYALLPAVAMLVLRGRWRPARTAAVLLAAGFLISLGWFSRVGHGLDVYMHPLWFPSFAMCFAVGMAMAVASVALHTGTAPGRWAVLVRAARGSWAWWVLALAVFGVGATALGRVQLSPARAFAAQELYYLCFSVLLLFPVVFGGRTSLRAVLSLPPLRWLGTVSYGLFLWHLTAIELLRWIFGSLAGADALLLAVVTLALASGFAAVSWYVVEQPAQRLGGRLIRRLRRSPRPPATLAEPGVAVVPGEG